MIVKEVLLNMGVKIHSETKEYYRTNAWYRNGKNPTCLSIHKSSGFWRDFKTQEQGDLQGLIELHLGRKLSQKEVEKYCVKVQSQLQTLNINDVFPKQTTVYNESILHSLLPDTYWKTRGISEKTIKKFEIGLATSGKMKGRSVIPIRDIYNRIIGFTGRDVTGKSKIKYKHIGTSSQFLFPLFNKKFILESQAIILVESPADILNLWESNVCNAMCLFGLNLSDKLLNYILTLRVRKIIVALNNEPNNTNIDGNAIGYTAAGVARSKLCRFLPEEDVIIKLPYKKDFGEMDKSEIGEWYFELTKL